ncbi:MAG TPA: DUF378 domain-containing protein [Burkholderiales bacterium]|nr:DUF378 domain-containing protein [Burkholderiales bacterium]
MAITADSRHGQHVERTGSVLDTIAMLLMIVGGLNWGLVGLFEFDLVAALFGEMSTLSRIVYVLVGLAALYGIVTMTKLLRRNA